ncbi:hypothetical protein SPHS6_02997 [Sphingobium sp. S6]|nr:hypothetical protein SPHS8_02765 [Sphingobium sp. S8]CAD7340488.1 hypothetical protein SPHS6_02997 [Sphingobium sp. S6]
MSKVQLSTRQIPQNLDFLLKLFASFDQPTAR